MGDITWTGWSHIKTVPFVRTSASLLGGVGSTVTTLTFNWKDTLRYSAGANYKVNDTWKFRMGVAFDETPTNDVDRTPRIPDQDRLWLAIGAQWRVSKSGLLDLGYAHEFIRTATVNTAAAGVPGRLIGEYNNSKADIFSVQYTHSF